VAGPPFGRRGFGPPEEITLSDFIEHAPDKPEPLAERQKRWAQESAEAWIAHDAVVQARDEKTIRLKALRLAKQAADAEAERQRAAEAPARKKRKPAQPKT
jgi:DNA-binding IscR family transcriptional regulator